MLHNSIRVQIMHKYKVEFSTSNHKNNAMSEQYFFDIRSMLHFISALHGKHDVSNISALELAQ
jgi:hypothetical protein